MHTKTLFFTFAFLGLLTSMPLAMAASKKSADSSATEAALAASDEEFLREMAKDPNSAIRKGEQVLSDTTTFTPEPEPEKPKVKYIYKGQPIGQLRRAIIDPRVDDGYAQGLLQQRGPQ
jgi:hypothetical protein